MADFAGYVEAGRSLTELHLGYESVETYPLGWLDVEPFGDAYNFFAVSDKKMRFGGCRRSTSCGRKL